MGDCCNALFYTVCEPDISPRAGSNLQQQLNFLIGFGIHR
jgi:hypothetical protein